METFARGGPAAPRPWLLCLQPSLFAGYTRKPSKAGAKGKR